MYLTLYKCFEYFQFISQLFACICTCLKFVHIVFLGYVFFTVVDAAVFAGHSTIGIPTSRPAQPLARGIARFETTTMYEEKREFVAP